MMKNSHATFIKRRTAVIGWLTVFTQTALPVGLAFTPAHSAAQASIAGPPKWYQHGQPAQNGKASLDNNDPPSSVGAAAAQDGTTTTAVGVARSAATGAVNNSVEQWLSQFGTARVQLNVDEKFKVNGSEADLLLPIFENTATLLFTQLGLRHIDGRNTNNIGLGVRQLVGSWMLGANSFYDHDYTGDNRRLGLGIESWRDYLKLSANSYLRLTDWHQSRDFADYDERPANGYDVRAEGWLPTFPQLGAKVMFEQYRGNEVALFGKDNRQKNPWAFTGGATYTPVPLVTMGAQHRAGKNGQNDSQLSLEMNYRLGQGWSKQLDPNLVGVLRTLSGTRYDLVERNNIIVLDYRKQESVTLVLPEKSTGKGGSTLPISFTATTKNALQRIDWDAARLVAAGGSITQVGSNQLSVVLPPYQVSGSNIYRFAGVVYDAKGNSGSATADIHVELGEVSPGETQVSADPTSLTADGKSSSTLSIALFDDHGNPVPNMARSLTASLNETLAADQPSVSTVLQAATLSTITEAAPGIYQAVLTAGTRAGTVVVSSLFNDSALTDITITQTADTASGHIADGAIVAGTDNSIANATAVNQVNATITDAKGNPLADTAVVFSLSGSASVAAGSSLNAITDEKGLVSIGFINNVAETVTVTATLENGNAGSVDTQFIADASTATLNNGDVAVDKNTVVANDIDAATFTASVKDANGNAVPDFTVNWATDKGALSGVTSNTDAQGAATISLKHTVVEAAQVTAQAGNSGSVNAPLVDFTADTGSANIRSDDLTVDHTDVAANGTDVATYSAVVKDASGNVIPDVTVSWSTDLGTLSADTSVTDPQGVAIVTLQGMVLGDAQVAASVKGKTATKAPVVTFIGDAGTASIDTSGLTVDKTSIVANDSELATFIAIVKDANGHLVTGIDVSWATDNGALSGNSSATDANGVATITLRGTLAAVAQVTAAVNSSASVNAPPVTLIADITTAQITSVTPSLAKITGTGSEPSTLTATLTDANGNVLADQTINWATTLGTLTDVSSQTNDDGKATIVLSATHVARTNGMADVTASLAGGSASRTSEVTVRAVIQAGGNYYWTMNSDHKASSEAAARDFCATFGGGTLVDRNGLLAFVSGGGDFANMWVFEEYEHKWYGLGGSWNSRVGMFSSATNQLGLTQTGYSNSYVCIK